jgi:hypothetical protein
MKTQIPKGDVGSVFKLWEYRVTHKQLLIRCPKLSEASKNVDLKFYNVEYVDLPSVFPDLEIADANQKDIAFASSRLGRTVESKRVIVLKSRGERYIVVAGALAVEESATGIFESPFALPPVDISRGLAAKPFPKDFEKPTQ